MPQKCKTGHGAFPYNQPHPCLGINTEGADFGLLLQTSPQLQLLRATSTAHHWPAALQLFLKRFPMESISGPWPLSLPSIYSTVATHRDSFQLFKTKAEYLQGCYFSFLSSNKWVKLFKYNYTDSSFHRISCTYPTNISLQVPRSKTGWEKASFLRWHWPTDYENILAGFNQVSLHKCPQQNSSSWYRPTHWLKT